ncbi:MAG: hypothetical protein IJV75_05625, partial [Alphaproteobacteria bacterium]|nr:hypothetical protein [Alphaproteobacteria bacterium]
MCVLKECPAGIPLRSASGDCYSCSDGWRINAENCDVCSNRIVAKNGRCVFKCPADKPLMDENGECYSCDTEQGIEIENCDVCPNRIVAKDGMCHSCDTEQGIEIENCDVCPNRIVAKNGKCVLKCPADKPLMDEDGRCHSCDYSFGIETENCDVCSNRIKNEQGMCVLKECPANEPLRDAWGNCYSCGFNELVFLINGVRGINAENCEVCPNRIIAQTGACVFKCPADKPLMDGYGDCYSCDADRKVAISRSEDCSICPNRIVFKDKQSNLACVLPCPADKPLMDEDGRCHSCDEEVGIQAENCDVCPNRHKNEQGMCVLKECPA